MSRLIARHCFKAHLRFSLNVYNDAKLQQIIETSNMAKKRDAKHSEAGKETQEAIKKIVSEAKTPPLIKNTANSETRAADANAITKVELQPTKNINTVHAPSKKVAKNNAALHLLDLLHIIETNAAYLRRWKAAQTAKLAAAVPRLAAAINQATGYDKIELHKTIVEQVELQMEEARSDVRRRKHEYEDAIERRLSSQKEINELLTRKHEWTPHDVERFTELYKNDHVNMQQENAGKTLLAEAENRFEALQGQLTSSILTRYHEEQMWSDKIRGASTWGTWMLMGVNIALFAVATFLVEPWKRKKLVNAFEAEVAAKLADFSEEIHSLSLLIGSSGKDSGQKSTSLMAYGKRWIFGLSRSVSGVFESVPGVLEKSVTALSYNIQKLQLWLEDIANLAQHWAHNVSTKLAQSPNFRFLQSKADISIFSTLLLFFGWSLNRLFQ